ncbi:3-hydroxyacyl-CoA dehydrogenase family protein [Amycolatopsis minnesotensis]|uniref:3-hydroxyacyl-CoA dehydrogenase family protein n=1 Tax=Amycolatopsis minnesotensis TaxID=337894 RepID=A0ABN2S2C5_9PSEU
MGEPIESVAVIGAGTMGQGIAVAVALGGVNVRVHDRPSAVDNGMRAIRRRYESAVEAAPGTPYAPLEELVEPRADLVEAVDGVDLVIEAVYEDMGAKLDVYRGIGPAMGSSSVLATNTSSLPIKDLACAVPAAGRFVATHFFNPAELVPGVEVARAPETSDETLQRVVSFLASIGKEPIEVGAGAGFVANRLQLALFLEALNCVRDGSATPEQVDAVVRRTFGFRLPAFGPFAIADMAGLDVYTSILETLEAAYGDRFTVPAELTDLVADGRAGVKAGAGFRDYTPDEVAALLASRDERYRRLLDAAGD